MDGWMDGSVFMKPAPAAPHTRRRSRAWIGFFVLLVALSLVALVLPIYYNLGQQLRPEQLDQARQRWRDHGAKDYDLTFTITYDRDPLPEHHVVLVRGGKVVFAACEGEIDQQATALGAAVGLPLGGLGQPPAERPTRDPPGARRALGRGANDLGGKDVPALFAYLAELLGQQNASGRRNFLVAVFDRKDGHPRRFIFRVPGTSTREEWNLRLLPAGAVGEGNR
jgi:hypothetical protein